MDNQKSDAQNSDSPKVMDVQPPAAASEEQKDSIQISSEGSMTDGAAAPAAPVQQPVSSATDAPGQQEQQGPVAGEPQQTNTESTQQQAVPETEAAPQENSSQSTESSSNNEAQASPEPTDAAPAPTSAEEAPVDEAATQDTALEQDGNLNLSQTPQQASTTQKKSHSAKPVAIIALIVFIAVVLIVFAVMAYVSSNNTAQAPAATVNETATSQTNQSDQEPVNSNEVATQAIEDIDQEIANLNEESDYNQSELADEALGL